VTIRPDDVAVLRWIATKSSLPTYQIRRACIVLGIGSGRRTQEVAKEVGCNAATIWRACRRYELRGLSGLLADDRSPLPPKARDSA
jgi:hypothetical protein